jgi:hypothetical protein
MFKYVDIGRSRWSIVGHGLSCPAVCCCLILVFLGVCKVKLCCFVVVLGRGSIKLINTSPTTNHNETAGHNQRNRINLAYKRQSCPCAKLINHYAMKVDV